MPRLSQASLQDAGRTSVDTTPKLIILFALIALGCQELGPGFLLFAIPILLWWSGILGRNRVWNSSSIQVGSEVVSITPKVYRLFVTHYEVKVEFSDKSWCRTKVVTNQQVTHKWGRYKTTYSVNDWAVREAVEKAVQKHEQVALKRRG